ncbi:Peptidase_S8 domain-containing protein [Trichoderma simmonsii]|uniref:Peptidase_S8 domain-containing protein n=1 Tax=Trichoderma simmonsii TaxID=1491479 RepID=A0A8G0LPY5_9HYPO|nr:Peptidase_S8 domain-containing protein [Trichoderma simmonsii]
MSYQGEDSKDQSNDIKSNVRKQTENHKTLWSRIKGGKSFVEDSSRVSPWLFASNPHGTQMANLICAIDPWCDLYVAKVTDGQAGIMPARVTRAIEWAISRNVDIISMSFAISEKTDELELACNTAAAAGIVLLCSTHDEGLGVSTTYPASFHNAITITACDDYGKVLRPGPADDTGSFQYKVQGQSVAAGVIPFLDSDDYISGSSVATAITAGLSSLILSCDRIAKNEPKKSSSKERSPKNVYPSTPVHEKHKNYKENTITNHLKEMLAKESKDYILLENFAEINKKIQDGHDIVAREIIRSHFGSVRFSEK